MSGFGWQYGLLYYNSISNSLNRIWTSCRDQDSNLGLKLAFFSWLTTPLSLKRVFLLVLLFSITRRYVQKINPLVFMTYLLLLLLLFLTT